MPEVGVLEMKKLLLAAAFATGFSTVAMAHQCPADMAKIDEAMTTASISDEDKATVMELRAKGEEEHNAGNHDASVESLGEAKELLGIE